MRNLNYFGDHFCLIIMKINIHQTFWAELCIHSFIIRNGFVFFHRLDMSLKIRALHLWRDCIREWWPFFQILASRCSVNNVSTSQHWNKCMESVKTMMKCHIYWQNYRMLEVKVQVYCAGEKWTIFKLQFGYR